MAINACAIIAGSDEGSAKLLDEIGQNAGFELVRPFTTMEAAERQAKFTPVCYFLFVHGPESEAEVAQILRIRRSSERRIQFSPVIGFVENPSRATVIDCIMAGYDDILTLPVAHSSLAVRLKQQIGRAMTYYETQDYFGPDRRRHLMGGGEDEGEDDERRQHKRGFRRYEFIRSSISGVQMLRNETVRPPTQRAVGF